MAQKSKWFRVAIEGASTDGRKITRNDIVDCVETFDPPTVDKQGTYGARIWLEHYRAIVPGGVFDALGDVVALRSQEDQIDIGGKPQKRLCLYAQINPTATLVAYNKARQKIYTSIEIQPNFADSGRAGFVGLGVTDSPASLGTDVLTFASQNPAFFAQRKQAEGNLFTEALETQIEFEEVADDSDDAKGAFAAIRNFFAAMTPGAAQSSASTNAAPEPVTNAQKPEGAGSAAPSGELAAFAQQMGKFAETVEAGLKAVSDAQKASDTRFAALETRLNAEPDNSRFNRRPAATGGDGNAAAFY